MKTKKKTTKPKPAKKWDESVTEYVNTSTWQYVPRNEPPLQPDKLWDARRPGLSEEFLDQKEFEGWVAVGVDDKNEVHASASDQGPLNAVNNLYGWHEEKEEFYGSTILLPSSIRVFRVGNPSRTSNPEQAP